MSEVRCFETSMETFSPVTVKEILKLMTQTMKTCELDPLPSHLLRQCLEPLAPAVAKIVNASLSEGIVPLPLKEAIVRPMIKKPSLDKDSFRSYRPLSNLKQISKILEKAAACRLTDHLVSQNLFDPYQSAYRKGHSTETALLHVVSDAKVAMDNKKGTLLVLIDLSAAFDTIDHSILINRLQQRFGFDGTVLAWLRSYLKDRTQKVVIGDSASDPAELTQGVPQGSVLGPLLFSLYVQPIGDIVRNHELGYHHYADDLQLALTYYLNHTSLQASLRRIELCIAEIKNWMALNYLSMNDGKTEFLPIAPKSAAPLLDGVTVRVGDALVPAATSVRNLGAHLDRHLDMTTHVSMVISSCYLQLWHIRQINKYLPRKTRERVVNALVTPRIDYCNSLLHGMSETNFNRLQVLQNDAARLIFGLPRWERATPIRQELHWLPVRQRVEYKTLVFVYKSLHDAAPAYLQQLVCRAVTTRNLRSGNKNMLVVARTRSKTGDSAFEIAGPILWNSLPTHLKACDSLETFKSKLKTHFFGLIYN